MRELRTVVLGMAIIAIASVHRPVVMADSKEPMYGGKSLSDWVSALDDSSAPVRRTAVIALGNLGPKAKSAVDPLIANFKDTDPEIRYLSSLALGKIGKDAVPALRKALKDPDSRVRQGAIIALGGVGKDAVPALGELLEEKDQNVRLMAMNALGRLKADAKDAVPQLVRVMKERDWDESQDAALVLGQIGPEAKEAIVPLIEAMKVEGNRSGNPWKYADALAHIGKASVPVLVDELKTGDEFMRREAARALGEMGDEGKVGVPALLNALMDEEKTVRGTALIALQRIGTDRVKLPNDTVTKLMRSL